MYKNKNIEEERKVYFYYESKKEEKVFMIEDGTKTLITTTKQDKAQMKANFFAVSEKYEANEEGILKYMKEFNSCNRDIKKVSHGRIDYKHYYNDMLAVKNVFKSKSTNILKKLNIENVSVMECAIYEQHNNGGMLFVDKEIIGKKINCFGYDFKNCYAKFLVENFLDYPLCIPKKQGKLVAFNETIDILDLEKLKKLSYGSYHVRIISEDKTIIKFFQFSTEHWYTMFDLLKLHELVKYIMNENEKLLLCQIVRFKSYGKFLAYEKEDLIKVKDIFQDWFTYVDKLKDDLPKNMLVKNLNTKLWGALSQFDRIFVNKKDINEYDFLYPEDVSENRKPEYLCIDVQTGNKKYELVKADNPYKEGGIARLKVYIVSAIRYYITKMLIDCKLLNNVVRICTDGIALNKEFDFSKTKYKYYPIPEDKTTGKIKFYYANKYRHICKKCKAEYNFKYGHDCEN